MRDVYVLRNEGGGWVTGAGASSETLAAFRTVEARVAGAKDAPEGERAKLKRELKNAHAAVGQECMVEIGKASVISVDEGSRNAEVNLRADHLHDPIHGHLDMTDIGLWDNLQRVLASGGRCKYRIIVHRQVEIDPTIPWDQVPDRKRIRDLVSIEPYAGGTTVPVNGNGQHAAPAEAAPTPTAPPGAQGQFFPAGDDGVLRCPLCGKPTAGSRVTKHQPTGRFAHTVCPAEDDPGPEPEPRPRPRLAEGKPYERTNTNLGSHAIQASEGMVELAFQLLLAHQAEQGEPGPPSLAKVKGLAARLLDAADGAQALVRPDHCFDRMDNSHSWARGAVRTALSAFPVPWGQQDRYDEWVENVAHYAAGLIRLALDLDR